MNHSRLPPELVTPLPGFSRDHARAMAAESWAAPMQEIAQHIEGTPPRYADAKTVLDEPVASLLGDVNFAQLASALRELGKPMAPAELVQLLRDAATVFRGVIAPTMRRPDDILGRLDEALARIDRGEL